MIQVVFLKNYHYIGYLRCSTSSIEWTRNKEVINVSRAMIATTFVRRCINKVVAFFMISQST